MELIIRGVIPGELPLWMTAKSVKNTYGINQHAIKKLSEEMKLIRGRKLPGGQQAGHVYNVSDIEKYLNGSEENAPVAAEA